MKKVIGLLAVCLFSAASFAGQLSGSYQVTASNACSLQANTIEKVVSTPDALTMSLFLGDYGTPAGEFSTMLAATIGDVITHPTPDMAAMGALTVRVISTYSADQNSISVSE